MRRNRNLSLLALLAAPVLAYGGEPEAEKIEALCQHYFEAGEIHGSILVAEAGKVIYEGGFGMANYEWDIPNGPDTKFRLGSITKQFTATLVMQLREAGKLALEDPISKHLPNYRKDTGDRITVHHLLTHTSGIPSYTGHPTFWKEVSRNPYTVADFVAKFCSGDLEFEPGAQYKYDNSGYFLLGAIIEKVGGKKYEELLREKIFDPIGMNDSGYDWPAPIMKRRADGYERKDGQLVNAAYLDMSPPFSAGALYSTVEDLHKWDRALYGTELLTAESKKLMFTPYIKDYGYGWAVKPLLVKGETVNDAVEISHGGGINGFNTLITRDPQAERLIVVLNNATPSPSDKLTHEILDVLYED
ncbi:MAG: serine hydrolase domain-containing protein [Candidatus Hydrogenedentota bacterium]